MESLSLLPDLRALPAAEGQAELSPEEMMRQVRAMDRDNFAIAVSIAVEESMEALFDARNVPDSSVMDDHPVMRAYNAVYPNAASDYSSPHEHYQEMLERGESSVEGFIRPLKGRLAEFEAKDALESQLPEWEFSGASDPTQPVWDLVGRGPDGQEMLIQVKTGGERYADEVLERMEEAPDIAFALSSNLYDAIAEQAHRLYDIGVSDDALEGITRAFFEDVNEGLGALAGNMGIDVPDSLLGMLPYIAEVGMGIKLVHRIISTEQALQGEEMSDRSRVHGIHALALMTQFGVLTVCSSVGLGAGGAAGTALPGLGNVVGAVAGGLAGGATAMVLNRMLQPRIQDVAIQLVGGDADDVFYLMNKQPIDAIGESLAATLIASPVSPQPLNS